MYHDIGQRAPTPFLCTQLAPSHAFSVSSIKIVIQEHVHQVTCEMHSYRGLSVSNCRYNLYLTCNCMHWIPWSTEVRSMQYRLMFELFP